MRLELKPIVLLTGVFLTTFFLPLPSFSQLKTRVIDKSDVRFDYKNKPVVVVQQKTASQIFSSKGEVTAGPDWIKELVINIKNVSEKVVIHVRVDIIIPAKGQMSFPHILAAEFGRSVAVLDQSGKPTGQYSRPVLLPGQSTDLSIEEEYYQNAKVRLDKLGASDFESIIIDLNTVRFDDDTIWSKGSFMRRDPNGSGGFVLESKDPALGFRQGSHWFSNLIDSLGPATALFHSRSSTATKYSAVNPIASMSPAPAGCVYRLSIYLDQVCTNPSGCARPTECGTPGERTDTND